MQPATRISRICSTNRAFGPTEWIVCLIDLKFIYVRPLLFFLTWRLYLFCPSCPSFSHSLLFHLLFCLQQLIIPFFFLLLLLFCAFNLSIQCIKQWQTKHKYNCTNLGEKKFILRFCIWKLLLLIFSFFCYCKRSNLGTM